MPEENATAAAQPEPVNLSAWQLHQVEHRPPCPAIQDGSSYTRKKAGRRSLDNRRGCRICLPWCSRPDGRTADTTPGLFRYRRKYTRNGRNATGGSAPGTAAADNQPGPVAGFLDPMKYQGDHHRSSHRQTIPDCIARWIFPYCAGTADTPGHNRPRITAACLTTNHTAKRCSDARIRLQFRTFALPDVLQPQRREHAGNTSAATAASTQRTGNEYQKRHQRNARQEHSRKDGSNQGNGNAAKLQRSGKTPPPEKIPA